MATANALAALPADCGVATWRAGPSLVRVELDRGGKLNALTRSMWEALDAVLEDTNDALLITSGDAKAFSAGADVNAGGGAVTGVVATSGVTAGGCRTTPRRGKADPAGVRAGGVGMSTLPAAGVIAAVWAGAALGVGAIPQGEWRGLQRSVKPLLWCARASMRQLAPLKTSRFAC